MIDLLRDLIGIVARHPFGSLDNPQEYTLIFFGNKAGRHRAEHKHRGRQAHHKHRHHDVSKPDQKLEQAAVALNQPAKAPIKLPEKPGQRSLPFPLFGTQEQRRHTWGKGQGIKRGHHDRESHDQGELLIHNPGCARKHGNWNKNGN
ncbi:hypothetical protein JVX88_33950 [Leptolyngbya sp. 7M]|nr:hypothetical protein JVX88_33950 [Leptolyngbya sp. 7M]